jgi:hypothetical protein
MPFARFLLPLFALSLLAAAVEAQDDRPRFRPALLGSGPESLVNRINTQELAKKGQKDGAVMFCSLAAKDGRLVQSRIYRAMPETEALQEELRKRLDDTKVTPAIYNHQPVDVLLYGTVVFAGGEKPRLRIFLHQDPVELKKESDFIGPQPVFGGDSRFSGLTYPQSEHPVQVTGIVDMALKTDAEGNLQDMRVLAEEPPLLGFGDAALADFDGAKFIPAFRDGDPDAAESVFPVCYEAEL